MAAVSHMLALNPKPFLFFKREFLSEPGAATAALVERDVARTSVAPTQTFACYVVVPKLVQAGECLRSPMSFSTSSKKNRHTETTLVTN